MREISVSIGQSAGERFEAKLVSISCEKRLQLGFLIFHLGRVLQGEVLCVNNSIL